MRWGGGLHKSKNLFEQIVSLENLLFAWQEFRRGKRKKPDVAEFEMNLEGNLLGLHQKLKDGSFKPLPYFSFYISDPKLRHIHKACVTDRVAYQAVFRVLYPIFDRGFIYDAYSSRTNKGTHRAVKRLEGFCRKLSKNYRRNIFILKCDILNFFNSINHQILKSLIAKKVNDRKVLNLLDLIIDSFSKDPGEGLPLGNVTSQLFANIYLNELDNFAKHSLKIKNYIRYTDDFVIISESRKYLESLIPQIADFLFDSLQLRLHPKKIILKKLSQGADFLGYVVLPHYVVIRTKTKRRMLRKLFEKQALLKQGLLDRKHFNQSLQSYLGILRHCNGYDLSQSLKSIFLDLDSACLPARQRSSLE